MGQKLYAVYPGHIMARDGDRHFISFHRLCELYRVDPKLCINMGGARESRISMDMTGLKILHPQHAPESYKLPES